MPARNEPKTLRNCCFRQISLSFDTYWMKSFNEQFKDVPRLMYVIGPFDSLTNEMIQGIIDSSVKEKCLSKNHFTILLQESVMNLDLCKAGMAANHDFVLQLISWRCKRLQSLNLNHLRNLSPRAMSDLFSQTPGLTNLDLSFTSCNDQVLSILGHSCLNLVKLRVRNTGISNSGIFSLCQACQADRGCRKVMLLDIMDTLVDSFGALHCIQNLPELQFLNYNSICQVVERDIHEKSGEKTQPYKLRQLQVDSFHTCPPGAVVTACTWCPYVSEAHFFSGLNSTNILALKSLKYLKDLVIGNDGEVIEFRKDILPVFEVIGSQLQNLSLFDVSGVELLPLGINCPSLCSLTIVLNNDAVEISDNIPPTLSYSKTNTFQKLLKFEMVYPYQATMYQKHAVTFLLKAAKSLKSFTFNYMSFLTDDILLDVYKLNPLVSIEKVCLVQCNGVSATGIWPLLSSENCLTSLELSGCWHVSKADFESFQKYAKANNFKLELKWR